MINSFPEYLNPGNEHWPKKRLDTYFGGATLLYHMYRSYIHPLFMILHFQQDIHEVDLTVYPSYVSGY